MGDDTKELSVVEWRFSLVPRNLTEAMDFAKLIAGSDVCPKEYKGQPGNILVAVQMGLEVGLKPLQALQSIAVINGRPTIWGDGALAVVRGSGLLEDFDEDDPQKALAQGYGRCKVKRLGQTPQERRFSMEDARRAKLIDRGGPTSPWALYPGRMLQMRARSWALRDVFADVLRGLQIREEVEDYVHVGTTAQGHQVMVPKRKVQVTEAKPAEPEPVAPKVDEFLSQQKPSQPAKTGTGGSDEGTEAKVLLLKSEEHQANGKTYYKVHFETEGGGAQVASTFDKKLHEEALKLAGEMAVIRTKVVEKNGKSFTNILSIRAAEEQPTEEA